MGIEPMHGGLTIHHLVTSSPFLVKGFSLFPFIIIVFILTCILNLDQDIGRRMQIFKMENCKKGEIQCGMTHSLKKIEKFKIREEKEIMVTWSLASTIIPTMISHTITIHNGNEHLPLYIMDRMVGHKLGKFAPTLSFTRHARNDNKSHC